MEVGLTRRDHVIYISGPYAGDTEKNCRTVEEYAIKVWNMGFTALCPHLNTRNFEKKGCTCEYADYIAGDVVLIWRCDGILMLPEWKKSSGAHIEHEEARQINIPIFYTQILYVKQGISMFDRMILFLKTHQLFLLETPGVFKTPGVFSYSSSSIPR